MKDDLKPKKRRSFKKIIAVTVVANMLVWLAFFELSAQGLLRVEFFDVGQGDAALIKTPSGADILIDGGPGLAVLEGLGRSLPFWDRDIDLLILTHADHDHLAGLLEVLKQYKVKSVLWNGAIKDTAEFEEWARLIFEEKSDIYIARAGMRITFDREPGHFIEVLYPEQDLSGVAVKDANNGSVVVKLVYGESEFLFTGDIYGFIEDSLANGDTDLDADVLKVAHHGSKNSASELFLRKVDPDIAVISVGRNSYGHPSEEILEMMEKHGIKIFRTDMAGDITFTTDGQNLSLKTENQ
ncbi:MAG TPA: ComEC/Rec2 family competence protein [Candidatus Paceibacterota bacterium]|nr:ComEC/Rec2 family competence protein [Candidatus Pacearchaeota archaeon]HRZ50938.1 ComEC/Rec2 family competence protein [Candidatus Paceibacterota bacterium]HSA36659.1 ComEC/Rec2 family competence protein [Candidatus Paceibacterota bacterium]